MHRVFRRSIRRVTAGAAFAVALLGIGAAPGMAQTGAVRVTALDPAGAPISGVNIEVDGLPGALLTGTDGVAMASSVPAGQRTVRGNRIGYRGAEATVVVSVGVTATVTLVLALTPMELTGIQVSVLRPDLRPELAVEERQIREVSPHDIGAVFRLLPGLDAVRRGGLGLDPVVRGLRETQVGGYVDGMRTLPGGPGGMDTPFSHLDPSAVRGIEVVKGPYALTWGSGNMSAVRLVTAPLPAEGAPPLSGRVFAGYDSNLSATEAGLDLQGAGGRMGYALSAVRREGDDYESGAGVLVPAGFRSQEVRGRVGLRPSATGTLTLSGWVQNQTGIDYPGRPLDAEWFDTYNVALGWEHAPVMSGRLRSFEATGYAYTVDHGMNNDGKPTALANPNRMPPFPMRILTTSRVEMLGGRTAGVLDLGGGWDAELGGDVYTANHVASNRMWNRDSGVLMMDRLIWGDARVTAGGVFGRVGGVLGRVTTTGTIRVDLVRADADSASTFFQQNASPDLASRETNLSGALTVTLPVSASWFLSAGAGSVVRTADANERFSDRSPSKKSQIGAEFMGDPGIRPERSNQLDLWIEADYPRWSGSFSLFAQRIQDHITIEATNLPRQSAMSAPVVYRYVNGEASYRGAEATAALALPADLVLSATTAYLWGEDLTLDEPVLGVSPWRGTMGLRWDPGSDGRFLDLGARVAARQDRISATRGEIATEGYASLDVQGGIPLPRSALLRVGVQNLFDADVINHLNARNPFTGIQVAEPGRVFFARLSVPF